jgi:PIN domain nuclease of toxin-antitoxin system
MRLLIDSQLLVWSAGSFARLSPKARGFMEIPGNTLIFSAASIWELTIKASRHPDTFKVDPRRLRRNLLNNGWEELVITSEHGVATKELPPIHKDPFDRILVAQATVEDLFLLTADTVLASYGAPVIGV